MGLTVASLKSSSTPEQVPPQTHSAASYPALSDSTLPPSSTTNREDARRAIARGATPPATNEPSATTETEPTLVRMTTYTVKKGDTASEIAQSVASSRHPLEKQLALMREMNECDLNLLRVGQRICIPTKEQPSIVRYQVSPGDTLSALAKEFNTTPALLQAINGHKDEASILAGKMINVPYDAPRSLLEESVTPPPQSPAAPSVQRSTNPTNIDGFVSGLKSDFGALCRAFESQGKSDAYSNAAADPGGASWGHYQIAEGTMPGFMRYLKNAGNDSDLSPEQKRLAARTYEALRDHEPSSSEFKRDWSYLARTNPRDFPALQHGFILDTHLTPVLKEAQKLGFDITPQTAEVFLSIGVQHGKFEEVLRDAAQAVDLSEASIDQQIEALYDSRRAYVKEIKDTKLEKLAESKKLSKASKKELAEKVEKLWDSVLNRYDHEERLAKGLSPDGNG